MPFQNVCMQNTSFFIEAMIYSNWILFFFQFSVSSAIVTGDAPIPAISWYICDRAVLAMLVHGVSPLPALCSHVMMASFLITVATRRYLFAMTTLWKHFLHTSSYVLFTILHKKNNRLELIVFCFRLIPHCSQSRCIAMVTDFCFVNCVDFCVFSTLLSTLYQLRHVMSISLLYK